MFDESKLDALIDGLLSGHALDWTEQLADLTATSALVAHIHLLVHEGMPGRAFETGRALAQALCYHALNPLFSTKAADLWDVVSLGVLEGLCDGDFRFARGREGYRFVTDTLCERWRATKALYGIHRMISGPSFAWNTVVDLNRECIRGFTTPELELSELLQSFLDVGAPGLRASSPLDRDPLFVTKSAALTKKKMQF